MNISNVTKQEINKLYKPISANTHKGLQGHALIVGGSYGKIGAVSLASMAALRAGCGLVTAFVPGCGYIPLQTANPEVMVLTDENEKCITNIEFSFSPEAIAIGVGMALDVHTQKAFQHFLKGNYIPLVIDADGINMLGHNPELFYLLKPDTILTPHAKELERIIGSWNNEDEKIEKSMQLSQKFNLIIVIKGSPTIIVAGEELFQNTTGNEALATAGSGDVLTGIISSFLAQSYTPLDAAKLGVYIHGLCAELRNDQTSVQSFIASDIINSLGPAFQKLGF